MLRAFRRSWVAAAAAAAMFLAGASAPAVAKSHSHSSGGHTVNYVAMGDSYASGNGTFDPDLSSSCYRSSKAYAPLVAAAEGNTSLSFVACSGATTADIIGGQDRALSRKTNWVTLSVGGNDVGFSNLVQSCVLGTDSACQTAVNTTNAAIKGSLPAALAATYSDVRKRAPKATVVIVGYPRVFDTSNVSCAEATGIDSTKATALNGVSDNIDAVISAAAKAAGFTYVDPNVKFAGHDVCAADPYVNGIGPIFTDPRSVYHPTVDGHAKGFEPLVLAALQG